MKVLFFEWSGYGNQDIKEAFNELGYEVEIQPHDLENVYHDEELEKEYKDRINSENPDFVFSFNYYQPIAYACNDTGVPYISWVYDNPFVMLYSFTVIFPTNHIFIFDSEQYAEFAKNRIPTIHYMPLAANPNGRRKLLENEVVKNEFLNSRLANQTGIAFVGSLYNEKHNFFNRMKQISDYSRGYLEGIMSSQKQIYGFNFVKDMMSEKLMNEMSDDLPIKPAKESVATREFMFGEYVVNREITSRERKEFLEAISDRFYRNNKPCLDLYTHDESYLLPGIINHGNVDHQKYAPFVYNNAKINLNITLRSIHTGIPLRAFEIFGAGGFLLTNYQSDFADCYIDGEDYVAFSSKEDMLDKIEYYMSHEKERSEIAKNGYLRTVENHTFVKRIQEMVAYL